MNVEFDFNYGKLQRELDDMGKRALPKAAAGYLNGIAVAARANMIRHNSEAFDGHVPFTDKAWVFDKAKPSDGDHMFSVVKARPKQEQYLWFQIFGGKRGVGDSGSGPYDLFVGADKTNAAGNIKWGYPRQLSRENRAEKAARKEWRDQSSHIAERRDWDMSQFSPSMYQELTWTAHVRNKPGIFWGTVGGMEGYWRRPVRTKKAKKRRKGVISVRVRQGSHLTPLLSVAQTAAYKPIFKYDQQVEKALLTMGGQEAFAAEFTRAMNRL